MDRLRLILQYAVLATEKNIYKIIEFAVMKYTEIFDHRIRQLLQKYPEDYTIRHCRKLSSDPKRLQPISYNADDPLAFMFVKNYTIILARILSIKGDLSDKYIKEVSSKVNIPPFKDKTNPLKKITKEVKKNHEKRKKLNYLLLRKN